MHLADRFLTATASLVGSDGKESAFKAENPRSIPGSGRSPEGGQGNPLQYSCLGNLHGQRSLVGYGPRGRKESRLSDYSTVQDTWWGLGPFQWR